MNTCEVVKKNILHAVLAEMKNPTSGRDGYSKDGYALGATVAYANYYGVKIDINIDTSLDGLEDTMLTDGISELTAATIKHTGNIFYARFNASDKYLVRLVSVSNAINKESDSYDLVFERVPTPNQVEPLSRYTYTFKAYNSGAGSSDRKNGTQLLLSSIGAPDIPGSANINAVLHNVVESLKPKEVTTAEEKRSRITELKGLLGHFPSETDIKALAQYTKVADFSVDTVGSLRKNLDALRAFSKYQLPTEINTAYDKLLDSMHPRFFNDLNLFINNQGKNNTGQFDPNTNSMYIEVTKKPTGIYQTPAEVFMHELVHAMTYFGLRAEGIDTRKLKRQLRFAQVEAQKKTKIADLLTVGKEVATKEDWKRADALYKYLFNGSTSLDEFTAYALTNPTFMKHLSKLPLKDEEKVTTLAGKLIKAFTTLLDVVMGNYSFSDKNKTIAGQVNALAMRLGDINTAANREAKRQSLLGQVSDVIDAGMDFLDNKTATAMHKLGQLLTPKEGQLEPLPENSGPYQKAAWGMKFLAKVATSKVHRDVVKVWLSDITDAFKPQGDIRQFGSDLFPEDEGKSISTWLTMKNSHLDAVRNGEANAVGMDILNGFNRALSEDQEVALTSVLIDTNASHLVYSKDGRVHIDNARLRELLTDDNKLDNAINIVRGRIAQHLGKDVARSNIVKNSAALLGYYMATGKATEATLFSARNIVHGHSTSNRYKSDSTLEAMVSELSSLTALKYTNKKQKGAVAELLLHEREGVYAVMDYYESFKRESKEHLFKGDEAHIMDGYSKELFDDTVTTEVAKIADKEAMHKKGFTFVGPVKLKASGQADPMGLYVSNTNAKAERMKGAVNLGSNTAKGMSLREINFSVDKRLGQSYFEKDKALANERAMETVRAMAKGEVDLTKLNYGIGRVVDATGRVVDYRAMMNKEQKEQLLGQDKRISRVLGSTIASVQYKILKELHEEATLEAIKEGMNDWNGTKLSGDTTFVEYDLIGPESTDPELRELYYMLPNSFKTYINSRADKTMAVRSDLRLIYFGYLHPKISNAIGIRELPIHVRKIIDKFEALWFDVVSLAKGTILLKMPWVIATNIVSNVLQLFTMGVGILESISLHTESIRDVQRYIKDSREKLALENALQKMKSKLYRVENKSSINNEIASNMAELTLKNKQILLISKDSVMYQPMLDSIEQLKKNIVNLKSITDTAGDKLNKEIAWVESRIETLNDGLLDNPIRELVDTGLMQSLVEDISTASMNDNNAVSKWLNEIMQDKPEVVRNITDILFLTERTNWYKGMQELLQISDLVARDVLNRKMQLVEKSRVNGDKNYQPEVITAMKDYGITLVDGVPLTGNDKEVYMNFVHKARLNTLKTRFINYTQPNGRYEEWMNKAGFLMFTKYFKRIQREIFAIGGDHPARAALGVLLATAGLDTVQGQSLFIKGEGFDGTFGLSNLMPLHSPLDIALTVVNPPLIRLATSTIN